MIRRLQGAIAVAALVSVVAGPALGQTMPQNQPPSLPDQSPQFGAAPEIRAQLTPVRYTTLSSEISARIDRIATRVGERFSRGDVLVSFDCAIQRAQLARAAAVEAQAQKTLAISKRLASLKSIGQLEVDAAEAEVQKAAAEHAIAAASVEKCMIKAPFSGVTVEQKAREFQYATPGQALLDIVDDGDLEIELIAPSRWLPWLRPGVAFTLHIDELDRSYDARVTRLGGRVDAVSQSVKVIGEIEGDAAGLLPGMSGSAQISRAN